MYRENPVNKGEMVLKEKMCVRQYLIIDTFYSKVLLSSIGRNGLTWTPGLSGRKSICSNAKISIRFTRAFDLQGDTGLEGGDGLPGLPVEIDSHYTDMLLYFDWICRVFVVAGEIQAFRVIVVIKECRQSRWIQNERCREINNVTQGRKGMEGIDGTPGIEGAPGVEQELLIN